MVIARPVEGKHRKLKDYALYALMVIFLAIPFIKIGENPLILLDIPARKFHVFGLTIWPQELYFLHLLLLMGGIMLFFVTSLYGRIWCGYACPQTIFTDLYDKLGRLVGGKKFGKKSAGLGVKLRVWTLWFILSVVFSFIFIAYFRGFDNMINDIATGDLFSEAGSVVPRAWVMFLIGSTVIAFGNMVYFRENMCRLICPYGRFQTALLDKHSPIVSYDIKRGEPRRQKGQKEGAGDCTACNMCNVVCPTGIDIREGLQIGCIACGLCVDACTIEMGKKEKPTLIDYRTIAQTEDPKAERPYVRPRTLIYGALITLFLVTFVYLLINRVPIYANIAQNKVIYHRFDATGMMNGYKLFAGNMSDKPITVDVELIQGGDQLTITEDTLKTVVEPGDISDIFVTLKYETDKKEYRKPIQLEFKIYNVANKEEFKTVKAMYTFPH